jgi:taurine dioxygenase
MGISIQPLGERLGVQIDGLDLTHPMNDASFAQVLDAFHRYLVIRIRTGGVPDECVVAFSARFGHNKIHDLADYLDKRCPELLIVSNIMQDGQPIGLKDSAIKWHSDMAYTRQPNPISVLVAHEVCRTGGGTEFTSMYAAWDALPCDVQQRIDGLTAVHSITRYQYRANEGMSADQQAKFPPVRHPVVLTHPAAGRKALYVSEGTTVAIDGLSEPESRELSEFLFAHSVQPQFTWLQQWQVGDIVMWDNRCTMHRQTPHDPSERRLMKRTTVIETHAGV